MSEGAYHHIRANMEQGVLVLTFLDKELRDNEVCVALRDELADAFRQSQAKNVVVDFSAIEFMSTVGFLPLLNLNRRVTEAGGWIVLCNLSKPIRGMFVVTRLLITPHSTTGLFEEEPTIQAAIANLSRSSP